MARRQKSGTANHVVGYGRPPAASRFRKGQSGNPQGRPKGRKHQRSIEAEIAATLDETVQITEGGRTRTVTKRKALALALVNEAFKANAPIGRLLIDVDRLMRNASDASDDNSALSPADQEIKQRGLDRLIAAAVARMKNES